MVTLTPRRLQLVRDCISTVMNDTLDEALAELPAKTLQSCFECANAVISAVVSAVDLTMKDVFEEWNAARADRLISLPTELTWECFRLLNLRGRITVSHVSRSWRRAALSDRSLWSTYAMPGGHWDDDTVLPSALTTMLSRSHPLPFCLTCDLFTLPDAVSDLISQNMDRIGALRIGCEFSQLQHLDAPALTDLSYVSHLNLPVFPATWSAFHAPRLQFLRLVGVGLPPDLLPFPALRELSAQIPDNGVFNISFPYAFPSLTKLSLFRITQQSLQMLLHLPRSLKSIDLRCLGASRGYIDYSQLLQECKRIGVQHLCLRDADTFTNAMEIYIQMSSNSRSMELTRNCTIYMHDAETKSNWTISCSAHILLHERPDCLALLKAFSTLTLPLREFWDLHHVSTWDMCLPNLRSLTISLFLGEHSDAVSLFLYCRSCESAAAVGMHMPALESLTLCSMENRDVDILDLLASVVSFLALVLSNSRLPLASICINQDCQDTLSRHDIAPFFPLAKHVVVERVGVRGPETAPLVFEAEEETVADGNTN